MKDRGKQSLYASGEDYLEAILVLQKQKGMVRSVDVARHMGVSKASVTRATTILRKDGFLKMDREHYIYLTSAGRVTAEKIYERHQFFTNRLIAVGVEPKQAEQDACRMEHAISDESFAKLKMAIDDE